MQKNIVEDNKELKRLLYTIEKAVVDFRMSQIDRDAENVTSTTDTEMNNTDISNMTSADIETTINTGVEVLTKIVNMQSNIANMQSNILNRMSKLENMMNMQTSQESTTDISSDELISEVRERIRKPRKQRGGQVFTDFKTLSLDNNNYEGNSIIYSKKDELL